MPNPATLSPVVNNFYMPSNSVVIRNRSTETFDARATKQSEPDFGITKDATFIDSWSTRNSSKTQNYHCSEDAHNRVQIQAMPNCEEKDKEQIAIFKAAELSETMTTKGGALNNYKDSLGVGDDGIGKNEAITWFVPKDVETAGGANVKLSKLFEDERATLRVTRLDGSVNEIPVEGTKDGNASVKIKGGTSITEIEFLSSGGSNSHFAVDEVATKGKVELKADVTPMFELISTLRDLISRYDYQEANTGTTLKDMTFDYEISETANRFMQLLEEKLMQNKIWRY